MNRHVTNGHKLQRNCQVIIFIVVALWSFSSICPQRARAASLPRTSIFHEPGLFFKSGENLSLDVFVTDPAGVEEVRCYFRFDDSLPYIFMKMQGDGGKSFHGVLPPLADHIEDIEYLFLAINRERQAVISKSYRVKKSSGMQKSLVGSSTGGAGGVVYLETESTLSQVKNTLDLNDSHINFTLVKKAQRFGIIAGLYTPPQIGAEVVAGYFGAFRADTESGMLAVKGYAPTGHGQVAVSAEKRSQRGISSFSIETAESDTQGENGTAPPTVAGRNWSGEFWRSDDYPGTVISVTATVTQETNGRITITTSKQDIGHHLTGDIYDDGHMFLYDSFDNEDWTTHYGPASELYIKIADFVRPPTLSDPRPPLNIIELTRKSVVEPVALEPILHLLLGK